MSLVPILLTFKLALITTIVLLVISIPLAYYLAFSKNKVNILISTICNLPLVLPPSVLGFYLLVAFNPDSYLGSFLSNIFGLELVFSFEGLIVGSVIFSLPFMLNPIQAGFENVPKNLIFTSYTFGKKTWEIVCYVLLPYIKRQVLVGVVMSFAHTIGEFGVVLMIGGNIPNKTRVASIAIYNEVEALNYQTAHFYALILLVVSFLIVLVMNAVNKK